MRKARGVQRVWLGRDGLEWRNVHLLPWLHLLPLFLSFGFLFIRQFGLIWLIVGGRPPGVLLARPRTSGCLGVALNHVTVCVCDEDPGQSRNVIGEIS